jgi:cephalosporin hydroxylase
MNHIEQFNQECENEISQQGADKDLVSKSLDFIQHSSQYKYSYHFNWMGRPIIQYPQDMVAMQELIWQVQPDLIIETGITHGGSIIFYASILELIGKNGHVLGIDIDIREHNRIEIEKHSMSKRITLFEGSSISSDMINQVKTFAKDYKNIMVCLDSNHTHDHVLAELQAYAPLVAKNSYCVVFDTIVEDMPKNPDRPWGQGNNPKTAVKAFLQENHDFVVDTDIDNKLLISVAPSGYLRRK